MKKNIPELYGSLVFNDKVMKSKLPRDVYKALRKTIENGSHLDLDIANAVAVAMKEWAVENGATHFTHWFQPMTAASIVSVRKKTCALEKPEAVAALGRNREKQICAIPSILQKIPVWSGSRAGKRQRTIPVDTGVYTGEKMENGAPASDSREKFITLAPLWTMRMQ